MVEVMSDLQLVKKLKKGDQKSLEELISRYSAKAYSLALRLTKNPQDAEEVLQDVFQTVYRKIERFEGRSQFSSWLYRITVNAAFMRLRKTRRNERVVSIEEINAEIRAAWRCARSENEGGEINAYRMALRQAFSNAIDSLPIEYRTVFVLRDIDGLSNREVSNTLALTIPAVKSRLHRSRLMLRNMLTPLYAELEDSTHVTKNDNRAILD